MVNEKNSTKRTVFFIVLIFKTLNVWFFTECTVFGGKCKVCFTYVKYALHGIIAWRLCGKRAD